MRHQISEPQHTAFRHGDIGEAEVVDGGEVRQEERREESRDRPINNRPSTNNK